MSSMIQSPPPSITIGGGAPRGAGDAASGPQQAPDSQKVNDLVKQAIALLRQAEDAEGDDADAATLAKIVAQCRQVIGNHQQMEDALMGGGPAAKMIRKNPGAGAA